jgi:hypothetical protein
LKKKLAFGLAGVSAALIAGWKLVQNESESAYPGPAPATTGDSGPGSPADRSPDPGPAPGNGEPEVPKGASKAELYEIAQGLKIKGRSKMSKAELRQAIEAEG